MFMRGVISTLLFAGLMSSASIAMAQGFDFTLSVGTHLDSDNFQFKEENEKSVKKLLLFGILDEPLMQGPQERFNYGEDFEHYIRHHLETATDGLLGNPDSRAIDLITGQESFMSSSLNKGNAIKRAKLAGLSMELGRLTLGGGYTWDERNPALLREETKGMILGLAYGKDDWGIQTSVLSSGTSVAGFNTGGERYDSVMMGVSWKASEKRGYTATVQYQNDGANDGATLFTLGTRFKF